MGSLLLVLGLLGLKQKNSKTTKSKINEGGEKEDEGMNPNKVAQPPTENNKNTKKLKGQSTKRTMKTEKQKI